MVAQVNDVLATKVGLLYASGSTSSLAASTTAAVALKSYNVPPNTLTEVGQVLRVEAVGYAAGNTHSKTATLTVGASNTVTTGAMISNTISQAPFMLALDVISTGPAAQSSKGYGIVTTSSVPTLLLPTIMTGTEDFTAMLPIAVSCQTGTAGAGDIVITGLTVEVLG